MHETHKLWAFIIDFTFNHLSPTPEFRLSCGLKGKKAILKFLEQLGETKMMKNLNTELAKIILHELSRQPLSRTELAKHTIVKAGTPASFESTFSYLIYGGYVEKNSPKYRAKYVITDKGTTMLRALEEPKH